MTELCRFNKKLTFDLAFSHLSVTVLLQIYVIIISKELQAEPAIVKPTYAIFGFIVSQTAYQVKGTEDTGLEKC